MTYKITWKCETCNAAGDHEGPESQGLSIGIDYSQHVEWMDEHALQGMLRAHFAQSPQCNGESITVKSPYYTLERDQ